MCEGCLVEEVPPAPWLVEGSPPAPWLVEHIAAVPVATVSAGLAAAGLTAGRAVATLHSQLLVPSLTKLGPPPSPGSGARVHYQKGCSYVTCAFILSDYHHQGIVISHRRIPQRKS